MSAEPATTRARGAVEVVEPTAAQRAFARSVAESKATIPHVYFEAPVAGAVPLPALVCFAARALQQVPLLNGAYRDGHFERYARINVAVAVPAGGTLAFPVIHDADELEEAAVESRFAELAADAAAGTLASPAYAGATFTIIDMSDQAARFTPVINHGQAATLGCGAAALTLACDARIVQAGEGAELLGRVTALLEA